MFALIDVTHTIDAIYIYVARRIIPTAASFAEWTVGRDVA